MMAWLLYFERALGSLRTGWNSVHHMRLWYTPVRGGKEEIGTSSYSCGRGGGNAGSGAVSRTSAPDPSVGHLPKCLDAPTTVRIPSGQLDHGYGANAER